MDTFWVMLFFAVLYLSWLQHSGASCNDENRISVIVDKLGMRTSLFDSNEMTNIFIDANSVFVHQQ